MTPQSDEQIRDLAYLLWDEAGRPEGRDWEFWIAAEQQLLERAATDDLAAEHTTEPDADPMFVAAAMVAAQ